VRGGGGKGGGGGGGEGGGGEKGGGGGGGRGGGGGGGGKEVVCALVLYHFGDEYFSRVYHDEFLAWYPQRTAVSQNRVTWQPSLSHAHLASKHIWHGQAWAPRAKERGMQCFLSSSVI